MATAPSRDSAMDAACVVIIVVALGGTGTPVQFSSSLTSANKVALEAALARTVLVLSVKTVVNRSYSEASGSMSAGCQVLQPLLGEYLISRCQDVLGQIWWTTMLGPWTLNDL